MKSGTESIEVCRVQVTRHNRAVANIRSKGAEAGIKRVTLMSILNVADHTEEVGRLIPILLANDS